MKILFASLNYHRPEGFTGVSVTMHALALALQRRGHEVSLAVGSRIGDPVRPYAENSLGYPVFRCGSAQALARILAVEPSDVLMWHCNEAPPMLKATQARTRRAVVYLQNAAFDPAFRNVIAWEGFTWLANSNYTADIFEYVFGIRPCVVFQPIADAEYWVESARSHVLFVNPDPRKGVEMALALAQALPHIPFRFQESWQLPEDNVAPLKERAASCGNVSWSSQIADMRPAFAVARILLMPSTWPEAWGRTASEAQVSGIPVLASRVGGLPEAVGTGGVLIDAHEPIDAWVKALDRLWQDPIQYQALSEAAARHARRPDIDVDHVVDRLLDLFRHQVEAPA